MADQDSKSSFLVNIKEVFFFLSVYLIFTGWMYRTYFIRYFGISPGEIDISFSNSIIYAYEVFINYWYVVAPIILFLFLISIKNLFKNVFIKSIFLIICFPILWWFAYQTAVTTANKIITDPDNFLSQINFTSKTKDTLSDLDTNNSITVFYKNLNDKLEKANYYGKLYLLFPSKEGYYCYAHNDSTPSQINIFFIKKEKIDFILLTKPIN